MTTTVRSRAVSSAPKNGALRQGLAIVSRALAAIAGGYALAAGVTVALALAWRTQPREEAIFMATLPSFLIWAGAVVWSFSARTALRAWAGIALPGAFVTCAIWFLKSGGGAS